MKLRKKVKVLEKMIAEQDENIENQELEIRKLDSDTNKISMDLYGIRKEIENIEKDIFGLRFKIASKEISNIDFNKLNTLPKFEGKYCAKDCSYIKFGVCEVGRCFKYEEALTTIENPLRYLRIQQCLENYGEEVLHYTNKPLSQDNKWFNLRKQILGMRKQYDIDSFEEGHELIQDKEIENIPTLLIKFKNNHENL